MALHGVQRAYAAAGGVALRGRAAAAAVRCDGAAAFGRARCRCDDGAAIVPSMNVLSCRDGVTCEPELKRVLVGPGGPAVVKSSTGAWCQAVGSVVVARDLR